jgi:hypothetical protein
MNLFLRKILAFTLISVLLYLIFLFFWGQFAPGYLRQNVRHHIGSPGHSFSRMKELKSQSEVDILFLGSSHTYRSFDTRIFAAAGYKTFNAGSSAQTPVQTLSLVKRYVDKLNPKFVIIDVYPMVFEITGEESALDLMANDQVDFNTLREALGINKSRIYHSMIYSFLRQLFKLDENFDESSVIKSDTYVSGGYVEHARQFFTYTVDFENMKWTFRQNQLDAFKEIVSLLTSKGIQVIIVQVPYTQKLYRSYTNQAEVDSIFLQIGKYYNFNKNSLLIDSADFVDKDHLNASGVQKFNRIILDSLKSNTFYMQ